MQSGVALPRSDGIIHISVLQRICLPEMQRFVSAMSLVTSPVGLMGLRGESARAMSQTWVGKLGVEQHMVPCLNGSIVRSFAATSPLVGSDDLNLVAIDSDSLAGQVPDDIAPVSPDVCIAHSVLLCKEPNEFNIEAVRSACWEIGIRNTEVQNNVPYFDSIELVDLDIKRGKGP